MNIIIRRKLKDFDSWEKLVLDANLVRKGYGSKGLTVYRNAKDPNEVYLVFEWDNGKPYMDYFNLPEVQKAVADTGTIEVIEISESFSLES